MDEKVVESTSMGLLRWSSDTPNLKVISFRTNSQRYRNHREKKHPGEVQASDPPCIRAARLVVLQ